MEDQGKIGVQNEEIRLKISDFYWWKDEEELSEMVWSFAKESD